MVCQKVSWRSKGEKQDDLCELQGQVQAWAWWNSSGASSDWSNWDGSWCFQKPCQLKNKYSLSLSLSLWISFFGSYSFLRLYKNITPFILSLSGLVFCVVVTEQCFHLILKVIPTFVLFVCILCIKMIPFERPLLDGGWKNGKENTDWDVMECFNLYNYTRGHGFELESFKIVVQALSQHLIPVDMTQKALSITNSP